MTDTPHVLKLVMAKRAAAGLYVAVHPDDADKFMNAGGGVLSIYAKDEPQRDAYISRLTAMGVRHVTSG